MTALRQTIYPAFRYADAWAAIAFLEDAFGFTRGAVFEGPNHTVGHAELQLGTASIGLNSATPSQPDSPWTSVRCGIYVVLPDPTAVDAHHAHAVAAGARIARSIEDTNYGSHDYSVWDCDGHLWCFGTYAYGPTGTPSLFVDLRYHEVAAATAWLSRAFGFERGLHVAGPDGSLMHAELHRDGNVLMAAASRDDVWGGERQATCLYVADPEAHHARAARGGAMIVRPLADTSYGARGYTARDREGFLWTFSTYRPSPVAGDAQ